MGYFEKVHERRMTYFNDVSGSGQWRKRYLVAEQRGAGALLVAFVLRDFVGGVEFEHDVLEHDDHD